jgi:two-component system sensor histidine kinase MprB
MTLRWRLASVLAIAVFFAFFVASGAAFVATRGILVRSLENSLVDRAATITGIENPFVARRSLAPEQDPETLIGDAFAVRVLNQRGNLVLRAGLDVDLPLDGRDRAIAIVGGTPLVRDTVTDEGVFKVVTMHYPEIGAVQVAGSMGRINNNLSLLRKNLWRFGLVAAAGAAVVGAATATRIAKPIVLLTDLSEEITSTGRLDRQIENSRDDEIGRLTQSFNRMVRSLALSREQQHRLVQDASHELRTPLTSVRTNIEVLRRAKTIAPGERDQLLADVNAELVELSELVSELVELATDQHTAEVAERVMLHEVAQAAVERFSRRHGRDVRVDLEPSQLMGRPGMLERGITNLLENAHKWGPPGSTVEVVLRGGKLSVADHGPGIPAEERDRVWNRFYRTDEARSMQGSGLGLAIVRHIVEAHAGRVFVEEGPDGGAVVGFELPGVTPI